MRLDPGAFAACTSPHTYTGLGQGSHTFSVKATQGSDQSATASYSWTVDNVRPRRPASRRAGHPSATASATFTFADTERA